jgi:putative protein-disulfide isomerase
MLSYCNAALKGFFILSFYLLNIIGMTASAQSDAHDDVLYYVYDPLCGWCYGFSPVINQLKESMQDEFTIEVISGVMV